MSVIIYLSDDDEGGYNDDDVTVKNLTSRAQITCLSNYNYAGTMPMSGTHLE